MKVLVDLSEPEVAALKRFVDTQPGPRMTGREAAKRLIVDGLIGLGVMPLGQSNRSRHAGGRRR